MADVFLISTQADFETHRQATLAPGDLVLFERGKVFNGMFAPTAVGANILPIKISAFGTGNKPVIQNNGVIHAHPTRAGATVSAGVFLFNPEYVTVSNLEVTNNNGGDQDDENLFGIYVLSEDTGKYHQQIHIEDNYVHSVNGAVAEKRRGGIHVHGYSPRTSTPASYNDLRIVNNVVENIGGVGIATDIADVVNPQNFTGTGIRPNAGTNVYIGHNSVKNTGRNSYIIRASDHPLIEHNISGYSSRYSKGHSFFNFNTIGATFQYNEAYGNTGPSGESDRGGFDADYNAKDTVFQYNYSHSNNYFAGIMKRPNEDVTIRYNLSVNEEHGAYFFGFDNDTDLSDLKVYNNTHFFDATVSSPDMIVNARRPRNAIFNNNVFYAMDLGLPGFGANAGVNVTYHTNAYFQFTPPNAEANALLANPQLLSPGAEPYDVDMEFGRHVLDGYRLSANSPYGDSGFPVSNNGGHDFWGEPLTGNTVGASQFDVNQDLSPDAITFLGGSFPTSGEANVIAATFDDVETGDDSAASLSQTFQVDSTFDLQTIYLGYEYDGQADPANQTVNVEIFEVDDIDAQRIVHGTSLLTISGLSIPSTGNREEAAIVLDSALTLEASAGGGGYALRITGGGEPGFEWRRTGGTGSVYPSGQAYENDVEKLSGDRDFALALSSDLPDGLAGPVILGDVNLDSFVNFLDIAPFIAILSGAGFQAEADVDESGTVDFLDIEAFIQILTGG